MAITSAVEQETETPQVILGIVRTEESKVSDVEKEIRRMEFIILQKRVMELNDEEINDWFADYEQEIEDPENERSKIYYGLVLQRREAAQAWNDLVDSKGRNIYGASDKAEYYLQHFFPSVVAEKYLLQPESVINYLDQLKPTLMEGLKQVCADKPEDPIQHLAEWLSKNNS